MVFVFPFALQPTDQEMTAVLDYVRKINGASSKKVGEVVIAVRSAIDRKSWPEDGIAIRLESEETLLDQLVDFREYFDDIRRRVRATPLPESDLKLADVYVEPLVITTTGAHESVGEYLDQWLEEKGMRHIALLGEYGQGKSTTALMWANRLISSSKGDLPIPIVVELRGTSPRNLSPLQLLGAWSATYSIDPQSLMKLLTAGRLVVILEGFDEMALIGDAEMRLRHFRTLWQFACPGSKVLITGRPNFFLDESEMRVALGIDESRSGRPFCDPIRLVPFDPERIKGALRPYKPLMRDRIYSLASANPRFLDVVSRPSLLHVVAVLWERERLSEQVDYLTSADVMGLFVRYSYRRQGLKERADDKNIGDFMALNTAERQYFMGGIAAWMAARESPNQITTRDFDGIVSALLEVMPDSVSASPSSLIAGENRQALRSRMSSSQYGLEHVKTDVRACGLLVDDPAVPGTLRFGHKSFMEYLAAELGCDSVVGTNVERTRAIRTVTAFSVQSLFRLPVALGFLTELLVPRDERQTGMVARKLLVAKRTLGLQPDGSKMKAFAIRVGFVIAILVDHGFFFIFRLLPRALLASATSGPNIVSRQHRDTRIRIGLLLLWIPMITTSAAALLASGATRQPFWERLTMVIGLGAFMSVFTIGFMLIDRVRFWRMLCAKMDIDNQSMHEALGTSLIPGLRRITLPLSRREFDRLLGRKSDSGVPSGTNA
jgi:DNA polymerase III delta prime subunit